MSNGTITISSAFTRDSLFKRFCRKGCHGRSSGESKKATGSLEDGAGVSTAAETPTGCSRKTKSRSLGGYVRIKNFNRKRKCR